MTRYLSLAALLLCAVSPSSVAAQAPASAPAANLSEARNPAEPAVLPLRERARLEDQMLAERLDQVVPAIMREQKIDMWVLIAREYVEDPVVATMLDAENMHARRRTILFFYDRGSGRSVERLTVSRYGLATLFKPAWNPSQEPE